MRMRRKEECQKKERLLDSNVVVKLGIESERLLPLIREYLIPAECRNHIEVVLRSKTDFQETYGKYDYLRRYELFLNEICKESGEMLYPCKCEVCGKIQNMVVLAESAAPNWRESITCPECACNNHQRFLIGKIRREYHERMKVFLYEYNTVLYQYIHHYIPDVVARSITQDEGTGEFYENPCELKQQSHSFPLVIANDIWEKIEDSDKALEEAARIVCKGGKLIFTTVFNANSNISENGVFGWDVLDKLKKMGFSDAYVVADFSIEEGYLGYLPMYFEAVK